MLCGTFKIGSIFKVCRVWFLLMSVDFSRKSMCTMQDRHDLCAESWMHFMSHALNFPGYCLAVIRSGYCLVVVWSDLVGYSVAGFKYKLVSCTLSRLSHESVGGTGIWPMTLTPTVLLVHLEVNGFSRNVATRKPGPKTHWEKNGPRKGCCHGAVLAKHVLYWMTMCS